MCAAERSGATRSAVGPLVLLEFGIGPGYRASQWSAAVAMRKAQRMLEDAGGVEAGGLWRLPANTLSKRRRLEIIALGAPRLGSAAAVSSSALVRTSLRELPMWSLQAQLDEEMGSR